MSQQTSPLTYEGILDLFQKTQEEFQQSREESQQSREEWRAMSAETDRKIQAVTEQIKVHSAEIAEQMQETKRRIG